MYPVVGQLPYLQRLDLAHPITHSLDFEITVLIGADFYRQVVEDKIIHGNGPTTVQSKLGYLPYFLVPYHYHSIAQEISICFML